jgi:hypothetical protein
VDALNIWTVRACNFPCGWKIRFEAEPSAVVHPCAVILVHNTYASQKGSKSNSVIENRSYCSPFPMKCLCGRGIELILRGSKLRHSLPPAGASVLARGRHAPGRVGSDRYSASGQHALGHLSHASRRKTSHWSAPRHKDT